MSDYSSFNVKCKNIAFKRFFILVLFFYFILFFFKLEISHKHAIIIKKKWPCLISEVKHLELTREYGSTYLKSIFMYIRFELTK